MLSRRTFLRSSLAGLAALSTPSLFADNPPVPAVPLVPGRRSTVILVFLRGGMDGLNFVVPFAEPKYAELRKDLAIPAPGRGNDGKSAVDLDGRFGLHPRLGSLAPWFKDGSLVALHAVGNPTNTRSHFEEQDTWECADAKRRGESGWAGRALMATAAGAGEAPVRCVAFGGGFPRALRGDVPVVVAAGLDRLPLPDATMASVVAELGQSGGDGAAGRLLAKANREALTAADALRRIAQPARTGYPDEDFARRCADAAAVVKADIGVELIEVDLDGWDTHQYQGGVQGPFADKCGALAGGLSAMLTDLDGHLDRVTVLVMTEFGRTVAINGTAGTDHGWGGCMLVAGGGVRRRRHGAPVIGHWPGLADLQDGRDLHHTTDYRDVICDLARTQLGADPTLVAPGHQPRTLGLTA